MRAKLGDVCENKIETIKATFRDDIDYIDISSIDNQRKKIIQTQTMAAQEAPSRAKQIVVPGDILVSTVRPNLNAIAMVEKKRKNILIASTGYCVLRCLSLVDNSYVFYFCQSPTFIDKMVSQATGASYPAVTSSTVKECSIPLPPLDEQRRIAAALDKVSNLITKRREQLDKLDELVKARFVEMFGNCNYPRQPLISLIKEGTGLSYGIVQPGDDGTGDLGVIRPVDMVDGNISIDSIKHIDRAIGDSFKKTELTGDELLITVRGTTGITALTDVRFKGMNVTRGIAVIRYNRSKINPAYLNAYLNTAESQNYIQEHTRGATLQQINLSDLRIQEILLPPMYLQEHFSDYATLINKSKLTIQQSLDKMETLKKALMQEYFG